MHVTVADLEVEAATTVPSLTPAQVAWKQAGLPVAGLTSWHVSRIPGPLTDTPTRKP